MLDLALINAVFGCGFGWFVWAAHRAGRVLWIGPERRYAPLSYWLVQLVFGGMALGNLGAMAWQLWVFADGRG